MRATGLGVLLVVGLALAARAVPRTEEGHSIFGFTRSSNEVQRRLESMLLQLPSEEQTREFHRFLTEEPHVAGTPRNRALAEWTRDRWREWGLDEVDIVEHEVLLSYPQEVTVEMTAPRPWRASMREDPVASDPSAAIQVPLPYHAYSRSGEVVAPVVYAASGNPEHYDWLASQGIDVKGKIVLVRYSVPYSYRGFKALTAERRGAAGILIYSDPADDGAGKGRVYPDGPWGNESHIQSGGIPYDFLVPGDPLSPGWASIPGAKRIDAAAAVSLPKIISAPLSARDARAILETLGGPAPPAGWKGGLGLPYRVGGRASTMVRMRVALDERVERIQTVIGRLRGSEFPEQQVLLGNHRDAWSFGGVDPSSGSASLMEVARALGTLKARGIRPRRTITLASWDAEEFTLTSSTEWGEQFAGELSEHAVAYLNVDSSTSGSTFTAAGVPSLNRFVAEAADAVRDPATGETIAAAARRSRASQPQGSLPNAGGKALVNNRLGSGSDYTVFLNFLGVAVIDMSFDGPYGVYHSRYDNHDWVARIGDPGFRYHAAMARLWGLMALRLANADALPMDYTAYADRIGEFGEEIEKRWANRAGAASARKTFAPLGAAVERFRAAARSMAGRIDAALQKHDTTALLALNFALMQAERAFLHSDGIPGRPWYRHQIYAPKFTYAPEVLPAVAEAVDAGDAAAVERQVVRLAQCVDRAALVLAAR
jgi:N-acetylated-alpha-linked acidic dipeptidase